ncbi:YraN family protein [Dyadobacter crusticola]|uniref:YraN family protein n=1 Tax=Dyadobacter crusticola TaxID=292407 RepID=UPI0004E26CE6|nr:YraN family protein [Dyadobacter crusticola]
MATHNDTGFWGEAKAAAFLSAKGFEIVEKNYRNRHQEIDLIVQKDKMLIFVEVKTRSGTGFGMPEEFVNPAKARLVLRAAENYIFEKDWHFDVRFDIVSVLILPNGETQIHHIEDAFYK